MKSSFLATHLIAVGLGLLVASIASPKNAKEQREDRLDSTARDAHGTRPRPRVKPHSSRPRALFEAAMLRPMESHHRRNLVDQLRIDWAKDDPREFLEWQRHRTIPNQLHLFDDVAVKTAMKALANEDPTWLLAHAKRCGDFAAMQTLATDGDPRLMLMMCLELGETQWPEGWIGALFRSGAEIDSEFHHRIFDLHSPELRAEAARAFSGVMFATSRHEAYAAWLTEHADHLPVESLARDFGASLASSDLEPSSIMSLPETLQMIAAEGLLRDMAEPSAVAGWRRSGDRRIVVGKLHDLGLLEGNEVLAAEMISNLPTVSDHDLHSSEEERHLVIAAEWKAWAERFPAVGPASVIRGQALKNWIRVNPSAWREIASTASLENLDFLHAHAAAELTGEEGRLATEQILDPDLRSQVERYRQREAENPDDPFYVNTAPAPWTD